MSNRGSVSAAERVRARVFAFPMEISRHQMQDAVLIALEALEEEVEQRRCVRCDAAIKRMAQVLEAGDANM